jgi:hypothetical protein
MFIDCALAPSFIQQISFCVGFAEACYQHEVIGQDTVHRGYIVVFNRRLVFGIECSHSLFVID